MTKTMLKLFSTSFLFGLLALGSGCSKSSDSSSDATTVAGTCSSGSVYSATYGCLPQSSCPAGYGLYNNQCIYVGTATISCPAGYIQSGSTCVYGTTTVTNACQGSCSAGYVQSVYGCLPQGTCMSCYGAYGRYCMGSVSTGSRWYLNTLSYYY